jgi:hypothetical protein
VSARNLTLQVSPLVCATICKELGLMGSSGWEFGEMGYVFAHVHMSGYLADFYSSDIFCGERFLVV